MVQIAHFDMLLTILISSYRCLSTFRVRRYGEARAYIKNRVENIHPHIKKSKLFERLPGNLSNYETWVPALIQVDRQSSGKGDGHGKTKDECQ